MCTSNMLAGFEFMEPSIRVCIRLSDAQFNCQVGKPFLKNDFGRFRDNSQTVAASNMKFGMPHSASFCIEGVNFVKIVSICFEKMSFM